jgi:hypothetical protein
MTSMVMAQPRVSATQMSPCRGGFYFQPHRLPRMKKAAHWTAYRKNLRSVLLT